MTDLLLEDHFRSDEKTEPYNDLNDGEKNLNFKIFFCLNLKELSASRS